MTGWISHEMQGTQMPDERLNKRLEKLLTSLSGNREPSAISKRHAETHVTVVYSRHSPCSTYTRA